MQTLESQQQVQPQHTSFSAISVAMATAVSENVDEFLAVPPEELAVRFELVPCSSKHTMSEVVTGSLCLGLSGIEAVG